MSNFTIYTGIWTDHSQNGLAALTLTLSVSSASLLVSGLATFITLVGARFWSIVAYILHQIRATNSMADGVHHQHQAIYRNAPSHLTAGWYIFRIGWAWRRRARRIWRRTFGALVFPMLTFIGFAIASVFSAKTAVPAYMSSKVLAVPNDCGILNWNTSQQDNSNFNLAINLWGSQTSSAALSYARSCYDNSNTVSSCDIYPVKNLPYNVNTNATCPLKDGKCLLGANTAYSLSTPWLDSLSHFGINDSPDDRVQIRREMTCSLVNKTGVSTVYPGLSNVFNIYSYYLGSTLTGELTYSSSDAAYQDISSCGYSIR
jgi:hypothetical protein